MEQERQRTHVEPDPGPEAEGGAHSFGAPAGGALRAARGWGAVAEEGARECESAADAQRELVGRAQGPGQ